MEPQRCLFNEVWKGYFVVKVQWAGCSIAFHVLNVMFQYLNMCILFITGWWFGTCFIFPYIGNVIIPTDIFFRGVGIPPTCHNIVLSCLGLYPHSCHLPGAWWRPGRRHSRFSRRHRRDFGHIGEAHGEPGQHPGAESIHQWGRDFADCPPKKWNSNGLNGHNIWANICIYIYIKI